jgi:hypothetical protein
MRRAIGTISILLVLALAGAGYYYFVTIITPKQFVSSFAEELERPGLRFMDGEFFLSEVYTEPLLTWEEYSADKVDSTSTLSVEQHFDIWRSVYLHSLEGYADVTLSYPRPIIMSKDQFRRTFGDLAFSHVRIEDITVQDRTVRAYGYASIRHSRNRLLQNRIGGEQKWQLICRYGSKGWRIIAFSLAL